MLMRRYEMPWRRAYEVYAAAVWASALLFFAVTGGLGLLPRQLAHPRRRCHRPRHRPLLSLPTWLSRRRPLRPPRRRPRRRPSS